MPWTGAARRQGDRGRDDLDPPSPDRVVETTTAPGMACRPHLFDEKQDGISIAIEADFDHPLPATRSLSLAP